MSEASDVANGSICLVKELINLLHNDVRRGSIHVNIQFKCASFACRLQVRAQVRADQLARTAQLQLRSLTENRPRLLMEVLIDAPKVAIVDGSDRITLIVDLGRFDLHSNQDLAATLCDEEAALYECFSLKVRPFRMF